MAFVVINCVCSACSYGALVWHRVFGLARIRDAIAYAEAGHATGKVVVQVRAEDPVEAPKATGATKIDTPCFANSFATVDPAASIHEDEDE
jgi:hypothetical protein